MTDDPFEPSQSWPSEPPVAPPTVPAVPVLGERPVETIEYPIRAAEPRRRFGVLAPLAGVIGLVALGAIGVSLAQALTGNATGDDSPAGAVENLAAHASDENLIEMFGVMAPGEVGTAAEVLDRIVTVAVEEDVLSDPNVLAGIDIEIADLDLRTEQLHPDVAKVYIEDASFSVTTDPTLVDEGIVGDDVPLTESVTIDEIRSELEAATQPQMLVNPFGFDLSGLDEVFVMTIRHDGRWYVSPLYTALEYVRVLLGAPLPDFDASRTSAMSGAADAGAVVSDITDAVNGVELADLDEQAVGELFESFGVFVPPDEVGAFVDYVPAFGAWAEEELGLLIEQDDITEIEDRFRELVAEVELDGRVTIDLEPVIEPIDAGRARLVFPTGSLQASIEVVVDGELLSADTKATFEGFCGSATGSVSDGTGSIASESDSGCIDPAEIPEGLVNPFVVVVEQRGTWYLSYVETALAYGEIFAIDELRSGD
ncbi:MAG: hypothetical protein OEU32_03140 [Acidimicrobiia bacterium]|nr:hypothetical protein [Acidimicrobiia bacterium]